MKGGASQLFLPVCAVVFIAVTGWWGVLGLGLYVGIVLFADWLISR